MSNIIIIIITIASFALGMVRDLMVAHHFGSGWQTDLFFFALIIPTFVENSLCIAHRDALIPQLQSKKLTNSAYKNILGSNIIFLALMCLILLVLFVLPYNFWIRYLGNTWLDQHPTEVYKAYFLGVLSMPILLWAYFQAAISNVNNNFILPASRALVFNLVGISFLLFVGISTQVMLVAIVLGMVIHSIISHLFLKEYWTISYSWLEFKLWFISFKEVFLAIFVGVVLLQLNLIAERFFASKIGIGALSHLIYAYRIITIPFVLLSVSVFMVAYTKLSKIYHKDETKDFQIYISDTIRICWLILLPISVYSYTLSDEIVKFVLYRGSFTLFDVEQTSLAMRGYSIGLTLMGLALVFSKVLIITKNTNWLIFSIAVALIVSVTGYGFLYVNYGVFEIAVMTSVGLLVQNILMAIYFYKSKYKIFSMHDFLSVLFITLILVLALIMVDKKDGLFFLLECGFLMATVTVLALFLTGQMSAVIHSLRRIF